MKSSVLVKSAMALALTAGFSVTANAGCGNGSLYCGSSNGSTIQPLSSFNSGSSSFVGFSSSESTTGPISMSGLGTNEFLSPTSCPVDVNGLQPGQTVLGCYQVNNQQQSTERYHYGAPHTVRAVRPIVYVRYPVPVPVYGVPVPVRTPVWGVRRGFGGGFGPGFGGGFGPGFGGGFGPGFGGGFGSCGGPIVPRWGGGCGR